MFEPVFDLKHHSPSSISLFIERRALWWLKVTEKTPFKGSEHTARGTAVEQGINKYFESKKDNLGYELEDCIAYAHGIFAKETVGMIIAPTFRQTINECVKVGIESFTTGCNSNKLKNRLENGKDFVGFEGIPNMQTKISIHPDGLEKPIIGYLDYYYDGFKGYTEKIPNAIVDNKVSSKTPSELSQGYKIQGAVYAKATGKDVYFHFIVPLKTGVTTKIIKMLPEDIEYGWNMAVAAAKCIETIKDSYIDMNTLKAMFFPNPASLFGGSDVKMVLDYWEVNNGFNLGDTGGIEE